MHAETRFHLTRNAELETRNFLARVLSISENIWASNRLGAGYRPLGRAVARLLNKRWKSWQFRSVQNAAPRIGSTIAQRKWASRCVAGVAQSCPRQAETPLAHP